LVVTVDRHWIIEREIESAVELAHVDCLTHGVSQHNELGFSRRECDNGLKMAGPGDQAIGKAGDESRIGLGCVLVSAMTGVSMQKWKRNALMAERKHAGGRTLIANGLASRAMQVGKDVVHCIEVCVIIPTQKVGEVQKRMSGRDARATQRSAPMMRWYRSLTLEEDVDSMTSRLQPAGSGVDNSLHSERPNSLASSAILSG